RSESVHQAVEDQHAAVSAAGQECAADGFQVRRVRRGADVRAVAQEAAVALIACKMRKILVILGVLPAFVAAAGAGGQRSISRTADGHPDLQGMYDLGTLTPLDRAANTP